MEAETQRYSVWEWILYIVILPLLFTALLSGFILQALGFDITGKIASAAKQIPGVHYFFPEAEQDVTAAATPEAEKAQQTQALQDQVKALEAAKKQLEEDMGKKDSEIEGLSTQVESLKKKKAAASSEEEDGASSGGDAGDESTDEQAPADPVKERAKVYAQMAPKKAAGIMGELSATEAKQILGKMTSAQQAAILEAMEPAKAALIMTAP